MATIKQYGGAGLAAHFASLILENDDEVATLPVSVADSAKPPLQNHDKFSVGSEAFCPSTGNAFVLTKAGWLKIT